MAWIDRGGAARRPTPIPRSTTPVEVNDLFSYGAVVFAATHHGIRRSRDDGRTWHTVLRGPNIESVTYGPGGYVALGTSRKRNSPVTARSPGGIRWHVTHGRFHGRDHASYFGGEHAVFDGADGIAVPDPAYGYSGSSAVVHSSDDGRHWTELATAPQPDGGLDALPDGTIYLTGEARGPGCSSAVYRSLDGGLTWSELTGSCSRLPLTGVDFQDPDDGVAVGGLDDKYGGGQVVETTSDGGVVWTLTHHVGSHPGKRSRDGFGDVAAVSPAVSYVDQASCLGGGAEGPCGFNLFRLDDEGRAVVRLARPPGLRWLRVTATSDGPLVAAAEGRYGARVLATSTDLGRSWRLRLPFRRLTTVRLARVGHTVWWHNTLGFFSSTDRGMTWQRRLPTLQMIDRVRRVRDPGYVHRHDLPAGAQCAQSTRGAEVWLACRLARESSATWVLHSADRGHMWTGHIIRHGPREVVATGPNQAMYAARGAIWRTSSGGAAWRERWPRLRGAVS